MFKKGHKKVPGSGKKKGQKTKRTLEKEKELEAHQQRIMENIEPLFQAQLALAKGTQIMVARDWVKDPKTGKRWRGGRFVRITSDREAVDLLNSDLEEGDDYYLIYMQDPNPKAIEDMISRVFGKSREQIEVEHKGKMIILDK